MDTGGAHRRGRLLPAPAAHAADERDPLPRHLRAAGLVEGAPARGAHRQARLLPVEANAGLQLFEDKVARLLHAKRTIGRLRTRVLALDVQAKATDPRILRGELPHMQVQALVDALAAEIGMHVDALDPPEVAVSPVAPLLGDEQ